MELETEFDYTIKILLLGDTTVGKTNIINMFIDKVFNQNYMTTSGMDIKNASLEIQNKKLKVQLWDTCGQEKYKSITKTLFLKVQGILAVYDITNVESFTNLKNWINTIKEDGNQMKMMIVGNKSDLDAQRAVKKEEAIKYAQEEKIDYIETSCKTGENIKEAIDDLAEQIYNKFSGNDLDKENNINLNEEKKEQEIKKCCK